MVNEYMERLDLNYEQLRDMSRDDVKKRVIEWDSDRWRAEVEGRETLEAYRMKEGIGGVQYDNSWGATLMFRARANSLMLGWRGRFVGEDVICGVCGSGEETLVHFLVECEGTREVRDRYGVMEVGDALGFAVACRYLEEL